MKTVKIGEYTVEIYDAIDELPMLRFHKYNKMLLVDAGIGSDLQDFDTHIEKAMRYARSKTPELAAIELDNMRQNVYFIQSGLSPKCLAFAVLVKSIDGTPYNDLSDDGLQKVVDMFGDVPIKELTAQLEAVKKKIDAELQLYFPKLFDDATVKEYYDQLKQRTMLMLDAIIKGDESDKREEIDHITTLLLTYTKPKSFSGSDSVEIQYDKQFENMCLILSQHLHVNPKSFTVLEYYNAFEYIKEQAKKASRKSQNKAI
ncbi:hypothetical protein [Barnesiella intestinihominis]|uniref:hypothetical protein n=1 Tax=Barnesiella intestinihominis TaxID=487174 RepID=UPI003AB426A4